MRNDSIGTLALMFLSRDGEMNDLFMVEWIAFSASSAHRVVVYCDFSQYFCETATNKITTQHAYACHLPLHVDAGKERVMPPSVRSEVYI